MVNKFSILLLTIALIPETMNAMSVKNIEIENSGITVTKNPPAGEVNACKKFTPNKEQLINYFRSAETSSDMSWDHDYYSSCISYGNLELENGQTGEWRISSSGAGDIRFPDGKYIYLFREKNEWVDSYLCGDEPDC
ncbi:hypothetical protein JC794_15475 [Morganella morganii]|uniref:hypothetical protein n=1 Tax=Morganella TaxID=581 RepID=UPI0011B72802|nr:MULTISPECIES: hypothetical protein [Morganella]QXO45520.1 hypothetical protein JC862_14380 [Morganella morganii]QXO49202.1 hypothetical protein JC861_15360 [Morganella morganii]QXO53041.1 hypothetical protein JC830_15215 [Morganella morganii]QXO56894.1 hypothetical protein JC827_15475 [Morganella morganii]QXO60728.1 hypothetical protein JC826_14750 [Morganella morganii]